MKRSNARHSRLQLRVLRNRAAAPAKPSTAPAERRVGAGDGKHALAERPQARESRRVVEAVVRAERYRCGQIFAFGLCIGLPHEAVKILTQTGLSASAAQAALLAHHRVTAPAREAKARSTLVARMRRLYNSYVGRTK